MAFTRDERLQFLLAADAQLSSQSDLNFHKASGNGGQKINKTSSAVRILHHPTGLSAVSAAGRSQIQNRHDAFRKLRFRIALECRCTPSVPPDTTTLPSLENPASYYPWLADLLDYVLSGTDIPGLSKSRLQKLLKRDPAVWKHLSEKQQFSNPGAHPESC